MDSYTFGNSDAAVTLAKLLSGDEKNSAYLSSLIDRHNQTLRAIMTSNMSPKMKERVLYACREKAVRIHDQWLERAYFREGITDHVQDLYTYSRNVMLLKFKKCIRELKGKPDSYVPRRKGHHDVS